MNRTASFTARIARCLVVVMLPLAGLSACKTMDPKQLMAQASNLFGSFTQTVTPEQEKQMGEESAALLLGAAPLVKSQALQRYVNQVGSWVALQTGSTDISWRFGVLDTSHVNAFAAPAGYVFITRGLLERLSDEAELAGVLAHEISHVLMKHHAQTMLAKDRVAAVSSLATSVAESQGKAQWGTPLANLTRGVYSSGLDKDDEFQADRMAVVLAARAGYDPYGLARVLQIYAVNAGEPGFDLLFSTHPSPSDRLDRLARLMDERFDVLESQGVKSTKDFSNRIAALKKTQRRR